MALSNLTSMNDISVRINSELDDVKEIIGMLTDVCGIIRDSDKAYDKIQDAISKLKYVSKNLVDIYYDVPEEDNIQDWKDLVIWSLPNGASAGMANDVEDALDKFKNVY